VSWQWSSIEDIKRWCVDFSSLQRGNQTNPSIVKPRPNDRNISTQHIATLLGATCCVRLATLLRRVATCWELKIELVRMPWRNIVARTWPNHYNIMQRPQMLREKFDQFQIWPNNVAICCVEMLWSFGGGLRGTTGSLTTSCAIYQRGNIFIQITLFLDSKKITWTKLN